MKGRGTIAMAKPASPKSAQPTAKTYKRKPVVPAEQQSYLHDFANAIEGQSDQACALVATAYLEGALITLLSSFFVDCETSKGIFDGALGDLTKCAQITRCLGFINGRMLTNLTTIGHIRNLFAHERKPLTFDHDDVRQHCLNLTLPKALQDESHDYVTNPADRFRVVCTALLEWLLILADDAAKKPVVKVNWHNFEHIW
jgi:hypothetical protein